jgi:hypothetical protein
MNIKKCVLLAYDILRMGCVLTGLIPGHCADGCARSHVHGPRSSDNDGTSAGVTVQSPVQSHSLSSNLTTGAKICNGSTASYYMSYICTPYIRRCKMAADVLYLALLSAIYCTHMYALNTCH